MATKLPWSVEDAAWLKRQLNKPSGERLLSNLRAGTPDINGLKFEEVALQAKERRGWENCIAFLLSHGEPVIPDSEFNTFVDTDN